MRLVMRTLSPIRRRRCSTSCSSARTVVLCGVSGLSRSGFLISRSSCSRASKGASSVRLVGKVARYLARDWGLAGNGTTQLYWRRALTSGPLFSSRHTKTGKAPPLAFLGERPLQRFVMAHCGSNHGLAQYLIVSLTDSFSRRTETEAPSHPGMSVLLIGTFSPNSYRSLS